jgi:RND superfamily putative drug exporter
MPIRVVLQTGDSSQILDPDRLRGLARISDAIRADPRVKDVRSLVDLRPGVPLWQYAQLYADTAKARQRLPEVFRTFLSRDGTATLFEVTLRDTVTLDGSLAAVRRIRTISTDTIPTFRGAALMSGGFAASSEDFRLELMRRFPLMVLVVLGVTGLMLGIVFRSVLVPVKAVIMNCFSVAAAFGLTVLVFQWGVGGSLIGLDGPTKAIFVLGPVLVFAIVFGLSMDYEVFLLSRMKEAYDRTGDNREAVAIGLERSGRIVTSAAIIVVVVAGSFVTADIVLIKALGLGVALAVAIDATIVRALLVPATMRLLGKWNWWMPAWLERVMANRLPRSEAEMEALVR